MAHSENGRKITLPIALVMIGILWSVVMFLLGAISTPHAKIIADYAELKGRVSTLELVSAAHTIAIAASNKEIEGIKADLKGALKK